MKTKAIVTAATIFVRFVALANAQVAPQSPPTMPTNSVRSLSPADVLALIKQVKASIRDAHPSQARWEMFMQEMQARYRRPPSTNATPVPPANAEQRALLEQVQRDEILRWQALIRERSELTRQPGFVSDPAQREAVNALMQQKYEEWLAQSHAAYDRVFPKAKPLLNTVLGIEPAAESKVVTGPPVAAADGASANVMSSLYDPLQRLLQAKSRFPRHEMVTAWSTNDESLLVTLYERESELTNKVALTWVLAAAGGDGAAKSLHRTLTADYKRRVLSLPEWEVMAGTMQVIGFIAARSDSAYAFLLESLATDYWKDHRLWQATTPQEEAYSNERFVGLAVQALGASGRIGAREKLNALREANPEAIRGIAGPIATGAFYFEIANEKGPRALLGYFFDGTLFHKYQEWIETENGRKWREWSVSVKRHPSPD